MADGCDTASPMRVISQTVVRESDACRIVFSEADGLPGMMLTSITT